MDRRIDTGRLGRFVGVLVVLVGGFVAAAAVLDVSLVALAPAYMFTPVLAALVAAVPDGNLRDRFGLHVGRLPWLVAGALLPVALAAGTVGVSVLHPGIAFDPSPDVYAGLGVPGGLVGLVAVMLVAGVTVNAILAAGEELGWRGYLLDELAPLGFWRASAAIGLLWGLWHVPVILAGHNFPTFPVVGSVLFVGFCVVSSPLYTYLVVRGESVLPAVLFHGTFNAVAGGFVLPLTATDSTVLGELVAHPGGLVGAVVVGVVVVGIATFGAPAVRTYGGV